VNRRERQGAILRLVREQPISTQTELAEALRDAGYEVVQTTVSRDINELGLVKVRARSGRLVYAPPGAADPDRFRALAAAVRRLALSFEAAGNLVVVTTPPGFSSPLAQAIDESAHPHVAGTIAGENTVLVVARDGVPAAQLRDELRTHLALTEGAA
jgi:transcriptional regulator of arginine metabolism